MKCPVCGAEINEQTNVCPYCDSPIGNVAESVEKAAEPVEAASAAAADDMSALFNTANTGAPAPAAPTAPAPGAPVNGEAPTFSAPPVYAQPTPPPETPKPKKKKKAGLVIGIIAAVLAVAAAVLVVVNFARIKNFFMHTFSSSEKYYQYVEKKDLNLMADSLADAYKNGLLNNIMVSGGKEEITLSFTMSDQAASLLSSLTKVDMSLMKDVAVNMTMRADGQNKTAVDMTFLLNGKELLTGSFMLDADLMKGFFSLPLLSDRPIEIDLGEVMRANQGGMVLGGFDQLTQMTEKLDEIKAALPDDATLKRLIKTYLTIVLESVEEVEDEKVTIEAGDVSVNGRALTLKFTEKEYKKIFTNVLNKLKTDSDVKKICDNLQKAFDDMIEGNAHEELVKSIDEALENLDFVKEIPDLEMVVFVDGKGEVIGRQITTDVSFGKTGKTAAYPADEYWDDEDDWGYDEDDDWGYDGEDDAPGFDLPSSKGSGDKVTIYYVMPEKLGKFGFEAYVEVGGKRMFGVSGDGKKSRKIIDGTFSVNVSGFSVVTVDVSGFDVGKLEDGYLCGKFKFKVSEMILQSLDLGQFVPTLGRAAISKLGLLIDVDTSRTSAKLAVALLVNDEEFVKLAVAAGISDAKQIISTPDNAIPADEWAESIDYEEVMGRLMERLTNTGISQSILESLFGKILGGLDSYDDVFDF